MELKLVPSLNLEDPPYGEGIESLYCLIPCLSFATSWVATCLSQKLLILGFHHLFLYHTIFFSQIVLEHLFFLVSSTTTDITIQNSNTDDIGCSGC